MAVLDAKNIKRNAASQSDSSDSTSSSDSSKAKVVDLSDKSLPTGVKVKLAVDEKGKPTEDAWAFTAPVDEGRYTIKLFLAKEAVHLKYADEKNPSDDDVYYVINMEGKLTEEEGTVFPAVSTNIWRGKNISTAAGLLDKLGYKVPQEVDHLTLAKMVVQAIKKEPTIDVQLKWQGWSKEDKRVAYANQAAFPDDPDTPGKKLHIVNYKGRAGLIEEIRAQLRVDHWYSKGEESIGASAGRVGKGSGAVLPATGPRPISASPVPVSASPKVNGPPATMPESATGNQLTQEQADDDLLAALEEA